MNDPNPYAPPQTRSDTAKTPTPPKRNLQRGPALAIVLGALIGEVLGLPLVSYKSVFGFLGVLPGAILGGLYFRIRSSHWPVDPTARRRRYGYAALATLLLPALTAFGQYPGGRFVAIILSSLIGLSIAIGILVSGDRRAADVVEPTDESEL